MTPVVTRRGGLLVIHPPQKALAVSALPPEISVFRFLHHRNVAQEPLPNRTPSVRDCGRLDRIGHAIQKMNVYAKTSTKKLTRDSQERLSALAL